MSTGSVRVSGSDEVCFAAGEEEMEVGGSPEGLQHEPLALGGPRRMGTRGRPSDDTGLLAQESPTGPQEEVDLGGTGSGLEAGDCSCVERFMNKFDGVRHQVWF